MAQCWGNGYYGQAQVPSELERNVLGIAVGYKMTCIVTAN